MATNSSNTATETSIVTGAGDPKPGAPQAPSGKPPVKLEQSAAPGGRDGDYASLYRLDISGPGMDDTVSSNALGHCRPARRR